MASEEMMMHSYGLSPYESFRIAEKASRRPSGAAIAGLVLGSVGTAAAIGAWIFGPTWASARARGVEALANAQYNANNQQIALLSSLLASERNERVAQGVTMTQTITDTVSGSQQGTLTAQQMSELSSMQNLQNTLLTDAVTGRSQMCPQPVMLYSAPQACSCPGCNN